MLRAIALLLSSAIVGCTGATPFVVVEGTPFQPQIAPLVPEDPSTLPPVSDLGLSRIGVLVYEDGRITISHDRVSILGEAAYHPAAECAPNGRLAPKFIEAIDALPSYTPVLVPTDVADPDALLSTDFWYGQVEIVNEATRREISEKYGVDAVLVILENLEPKRTAMTLPGRLIGDGKMGAVNVPPGKGIVTRRRGKAFAFATFSAQIIDLKTGRQTPHGAYTQAAAWHIGEHDWMTPWDPASDYARDLCRRIEFMDDSNVSQTLWRLRIE